MNHILFYRLNEPYGEFSNFSPYPIQFKGRRWPTSEHYFQAQKFAGTEHEEAVRLAKSPMVAARMGRSRERPLRSDWETSKDAIMREALRAIERYDGTSSTQPLASAPTVRVKTKPEVRTT